MEPPYGRHAPDSFSIPIYMSGEQDDIFSQWLWDVHRVVLVLAEVPPVFLPGDQTLGVFPVQMAPDEAAARELFSTLQPLYCAFD